MHPEVSQLSQKLLIVSCIFALKINTLVDPCQSSAIISGLGWPWTYCYLDRSNGWRLVIIFQQWPHINSHMIHINVGKTIS